MVKKNIAMMAVCVIGLWACIIRVAQNYDMKAVGLMAVALILEAVLMGIIDGDGERPPEEVGEDDGRCEVDQDHD